MRGPSVVVVGGGLAGIAAACELVDSGYRVTVVEKRPFLGGRAYSYVDRKTGLEVDNGQHVFLQCCTEYIRFLKRLGVFHRTHLQRRMRLRVIDKLTGVSLLESGGLPSPFHMLPSFLRYRPLALWEKLLAIYGLARLRSVDRRGERGLDDITFYEWLKRQGQSENAIASFWNLIIQPTLNGNVKEVSADLALMVFQEGFLRSRDGANIGYARVGLSALLAQAAADYIRQRGGHLRLGEGAAALIYAEGRITGLRLSGGETLSADYYVLALPPQGLSALLPFPLRDDPFFAPARRVGASPIVNLHLWYDRPVTSIDFAAFLNTPLQWVFNKSKLWGQGPNHGQYLDISLSGAHDFIDMPSREIVGLFAKEMQVLFPLARGAQINRALVVKQPEATFAAVPGIARLRLPQRIPIANLFLAGDWTDTGWPATMESAVRSGLAAARQLAAAHSRKEVRGREEVAIMGGAQGQ